MTFHFIVGSCCGLQAYGNMQSGRREPKVPKNILPLLWTVCVLDISSHIFKQIKIQNIVHNVSETTSASVFTYKSGQA